MKNASPLEIAWSVIALCGMVVSLLATAHYIADLRYYLASQANEKRRIVAWGNVRTEAGRVAKLAALLGIGIVAMVTPAPVLTKNVIASYISGGLIIAVLLLITGLTVWDYVDDVHLRRLLEEDDQQAQQHESEHHPCATSEGVCE